MNEPIRPLTDEDLTFWRSEIDRSRKDRDDRVERWGVADNLERYAPSQAQPAQINTGKDFSDVERKKAALFYDTPSVILTADAGVPPQALQLHQEYLNTLLSSRFLAAKPTALQAIQGCLVAIQPSPTEIGYTAVTVDQPVMDPMTGQPQVGPDGQPVTQPIPVHEAFFWTHLSEKATLIPVDFKHTRYDEAVWIGYDWRKPASQVRRDYGLEEDWTAGDSVDPPYFEPAGTDRSVGAEPMVSGVTLWYQAAARDPAVTHPLKHRVLVLADGQDAPLEHRDAPYQDFLPDGRLTPQSLPGYPLHPLALRDGIDTAWVHADSTITASLSSELNKFREQIIVRRDASRQHVLVDVSKLNPDARQKFEGQTLPHLIGVESGALEGGVNSIMDQVPGISLGRESYDGQNIIERDREGILGIGSNQVGNVTQTKRTATEVSTMQRNTDARFEQERQKVLEWWLRGVQKLSALVLRYGDRLALEILGAQRGPQWVEFRNQGVFGPFNFEVLIDSGQYVDIEARKRQSLQLYNLVRKDPSINPAPLMRRLAEEHGLDMTEFLQPPPPQEPKPDPPKVSLAVSAQDLIPSAPWYAATYAMLTAAGVANLPAPVVSPMAMSPGGAPPVPAQPSPSGQPHGGPTPTADRINQHQLDQTGQRSGPQTEGV